MRGALFVLVLAGMAFYALLQREEVERLNLEQAETKADQIENDVTDAVQQVQEKLDSALDGN